MPIYHPNLRTYFFPLHVKGWPLPAVALTIGIGHKLRNAESSNMDIIPRTAELKWEDLSGWRQHTTPE